MTRTSSTPLWAVFGLLCLALVGCGPTTFVVGITPGDRKLTSTLVHSDGKLASARVAIIDVTGLLVSVNKPGLLDEGDNPLSDLSEALKAAGDDPRVCAVILRINSPGGAVTASDAMYREVLRFKEQTGKPVVALLMDVAASGGYYLACAADDIVAYPTTVTGSVGVIVQTVSFKPALDRWGIVAESLTSGPNKDAGSPLSTMTDSHRAVLRSLVDDFYARFVAVVRERRPGIPADRFDEVTDGRVLGGEAAHALGLVDQIGDLRAAFALARQHANVERADLIVYHRPLEHVGSPFARAPHVAGQINLLQLNIDALSGVDAPVGFYYLWQPGLP